MKTQNKRLVKNVTILYFRMILNMLMTFYVVRIVFQVLGVVDYGIYNVVGGVVMLFQMFNGTMGNAYQRFFSYELGKKDGTADFSKIYTHSMWFNFLLILIVILLTETIGLWFLNNKMVITPDRMYAANIVYQYAILSFLVTIAYSPYYAVIIAYEKMSIFGYISLLEVFLKFILTVLLVKVDADKLILYSQLNLFITILISLCYVIYCKHKYDKCKIKKCFDIKIFKDMSSFVGVTLFNKMAWMAQGQGINIVLNLFYGPIVNAARGIAYQVNNAVSSFVNNYRTAFNPQIIKLAANKEFENLANYSFISAKYTYLLLLALIVPLVFECSYLLNLWIGEHPQETELFTIIVLLTTLVQCFEASFMIVFQAINSIKKVYTFSSFAYLLVLPIAYISFKIGITNASFAFYLILLATIIVDIYVFISLCTSFLCINIKKIVFELVLPLFGVSIIVFIITYAMWINLPESFGRLVATVILSLFCNILTSYMFILSHEERKRLKCFIKNKFNKYNR